jgi:Adenylate and Guanylate cyclase catalytic domain
MNVNVQRAVDAMDEFVLSTASLISHTNSTDWPFVTVPEFERSAAGARFLSSAPLVVLSPLVNQSARSSWQAYATLNQDWTSSNQYIPVFIHNGTDGSSPLPADAPGPFSPVWQMSPAPSTDVAIVNFDLYSNPVFQPLYDQVRDQISSAWSDFCNTTDLFGESAPNTGGSPQSILIQPIVSASTVEPLPPAQVSAAIVSVWNWELYLQDILPPNVNGMIVIVADSYGRAGTFELYGANVTFVGTGDLYEPAYASMEYFAPLACNRPFTPSLGQLSRILLGGKNATSLSSDSPVSPCAYSLYIYPSSTFQAAYTSGSLPAIYCTFVVLIVVGTTLAFVLFDWYTRRKEDVIIAKAERTHAIVASLFPEAIQDRLLGTPGTGGKSAVYLGGKAGLTSYLRDVDEGEAVDLESKPIADLFPNTTVSFCDCEGFTAWSSTREPAQIFLLLETIFSAFDEIAKERGVFKVSHRLVPVIHLCFNSFLNQSFLHLENEG